MTTLNEDEIDFILQQLRAFDAIATSLHREVGNEASVELVERMKHIREMLGDRCWERDS